MRTFYSFAALATTVGCTAFGPADPPYIGPQDAGPDVADAATDAGPDDAGGVCVPCPAGRGATSACIVVGVCQIMACDPGLANCTGYSPEGCDVQIETDDQNCGGCGIRCSATTLPHVSFVGCAGGTCSKVLACIYPWADCNGDPSDGCEMNIENDVNNCGRCGPCPFDPLCSPPAFDQCVADGNGLHCACTT